MPFPDLPPDRIPGSPGHLNDHQLIDQALDYIQQSGYRDDPDFPPLPDVPVLGQSGHVTAHDRILAVLEYVKGNPSGAFVWAQVSNTPTGTYKGSDGHTYAYYLFKSDGTLTVTTEGLLDVLLVAGGGGGTLDKSNGIGAWSAGLHVMNADTYTVTIGRGGMGGGNPKEASGTPSSIGGIASPIGGWGNQYSSPLVSDITGANVTYCKPRQGSPRPNHGDGGESLDNTNGASGVVIAKTRLN